MSEVTHIPVMLQEVLEHLSPQESAVYIDVTFGEGGYTKALLDATNCKVIAFDRDPVALKKAEKLQDLYGERFHFIPKTFSHLIQSLKEIGVHQVDGIVADLGVSSPQIDAAERGFSFMKEGPLDMRMGGNELSAADVINTFSEQDLADIIWKYGEEKKSRRIAKNIVNTRQQKKFTTTKELVEIILSAVGRYGGKIHPATRTFQALRIYVNNELSELESLLTQSLSILKPEGRLVCVSFHSLEDRIIKSFLNKYSESSRHINKYAQQQSSSALLRVLTKKPISPLETETKNNPRARSAKLRAAIRTSVPFTSMVAFVGIMISGITSSWRWA